jgi:4-amino-4-deoxy-L-arabinose transferase-like glycosyltransferase
LLIPPATRWLASERSATWAALGLTVALLAMRLAVLFASPIQLHPDEAQYWVWSRTLDWGYFSKPPMIAWMIRLTTDLGGQTEPWVRLSSVFMHAAAGLLLFDVGRRLFGPRAGLLAFAVYSLMPGVQLSAGVASTDAPLTAFLCAALWAYVRLVQSPGARLGLAWGGLTGLSVGLAFLSKYAAVYFLAGLVFHALIDENARRAWRPRALAAAAAAFVTVLAPNLAWNARNGFVTIGHTAQNADWQATSFFHPGELAAFVAGQAGVFGPLPFLALLAGTGLAIRRRRTGQWPQTAEALLLCLTLPALAAVSLQALLSRANANWAFAAYGPASVLVAAWLVRWRARWWTMAALVLQGALAIGFLAAAAQPSLADRAGLAASLKRSRGWAEATDALLDREAREPGLTAIAVDSRFLYNEMRYYGRDRLSAAGAPPLRMWVREHRANNQAELKAPLTPDLRSRVLAVSLTPQFTGEFLMDFRRVTARPPLVTPLDAERSRDALLFVGEGFAPRPRDPVTGLPVAP